jgi:hypothetical protein
LGFLAAAQLPTGELPYRIPGRPHYLCYQYNAFEFLAIARYAENTGDRQADAVLEKLAAFLLGGATPTGACRSSCDRTYPEVDYYTGALALALLRAEPYVRDAARLAAKRALERLLSVQRPDGSFAYSRRDYGLPFLWDRRGYPRTLAIIGYCLAGAAAWLDPQSTAGHGLAVAI